MNQKFQRILKNKKIYYWAFNISFSTFIATLIIPHTAALKSFSFFFSWLFILIFYKLNKRKVNFKTGLEKFIIPIIFSMILSTIFSMNFSYSLRVLFGEFLWQITAFYLLFIGIVKINYQPLFFNKIWILTALLISIDGIYGYFTKKFIWIDDIVGGRAITFFGTYNRSAFYVTLILPLALYFFYFSKKLKEIVFGAISSIIIIFFIIITYSRAGLICMISSIIFFLFIKNKKLLILIIPISILIFPLIAPNKLVKRSATIFDIENLDSEYSTGSRYWLWKSTLKMISDKPIFGWGIGSRIFRKIYPFYRESPAMGYNYENSHNLYLQILWERGIVGFLTFLFLFVIALKKSFKALFYLNSYKNKYLLVTYIFILIIFSIYGLVTYRFEDEGGFYFWLLLSLSMKLTQM